MRIELRKIGKADRPLLKAWMDQPHVSGVYGDSEKWLEEIYSGGFGFIKCFVAEAEGRPVGFGQYYDCFFGGEDWYEAPEEGKLFSMCLFTGDPARLRQSCGTAICVRLLDEIRANTAAKAVLMNPKTQAAEAALKAFGFTKWNSIYRLELF